VYRAPEQLTGGAADVRADVYAAAAVLYEMVTGAPPHATSPDPLSRKLIEPPQSPRMFRPEIPPELEALIMSSLERDPEARPASIAVFEAGLVSVSRARDAEPQADEAARAAPASPDRRRARREAAFQAIGELLATTEGNKEADLLPPLIESPFDDQDSSSRPTPLSVPTLDLIASTSGPLDVPPFAAPAPAAVPPPPAPSVVNIPPSALSGAWQASVPPSAPSREFGGAMLARYGAETGETTGGGRGRTLAFVFVGAGLGLAALLAYLFLK
jgi:serine/threonine-protein kinase